MGHHPVCTWYPECFISLGTRPEMMHECYRDRRTNTWAFKHIADFCPNSNTTLFQDDWWCQYWWSPWPIPHSTHWDRPESRAQPSTHPGAVRTDSTSATLVPSRGRYPLTWPWYESIHHARLPQNCSRSLRHLSSSHISSEPSEPQWFTTPRMWWPVTGPGWLHSLR